MSCALADSHKQQCHALRARVDEMISSNLDLHAIQRAKEAALQCEHAMQQTDELCQSTTSEGACKELANSGCSWIGDAPWGGSCHSPIPPYCADYSPWLANQGHRVPMSCATLHQTCEIAGCPYYDGPQKVGNCSLFPTFNPTVRPQDCRGENGCYVFDNAGKKIDIHCTGNTPDTCRITKVYPKDFTVATAA